MQNVTEKSTYIFATIVPQQGPELDQDERVGLLAAQPYDRIGWGRGWGWGEAPGEGRGEGRGEAPGEGRAGVDFGSFLGRFRDLPGDPQKPPFSPPPPKPPPPLSKTENLEKMTKIKATSSGLTPNFGHFLSNFGVLGGGGKIGVFGSFLGVLGGSPQNPQN